MYAMLLTCRSEMRKALNTPLVSPWDALISLRDPHIIRFILLLLVLNDLFATYAGSVYERVLLRRGNRIKCFVYRVWLYASVLVYMCSIWHRVSSRYVCAQPVTTTSVISQLVITAHCHTHSICIRLPNFVYTNYKQKPACVKLCAPVTLSQIICTECNRHAYSIQWYLWNVSHSTLYCDGGGDGDDGGHFSVYIFMIMINSFAVCTLVIDECITICWFVFFSFRLTLLPLFILKIPTIFTLTKNNITFKVVYLVIFHLIIEFSAKY